MRDMKFVAYRYDNFSSRGCGVIPATTFAATEYPRDSYHHDGAIFNGCSNALITERALTFIEFSLPVNINGRQSPVVHLPRIQLNDAAAFGPIATSVAATM